ncbi:MAG: DUF4349 domain-containing protein [Thaumarchaeota archaeon]|nr:DUF4349 domain-containing protein [Nitrososphaerota archaeon]
MKDFGGVTGKRALIGVAAIIVVGGFVLALISNSALAPGSFSPAAPGYSAGETSFFSMGATNDVGNGNYIGPGYTQVVGPAKAVTTYTASTTVGGTTPQVSGVNSTQGTPTGAGGLIEFSSDLTLQASSPQQTASGIIALAYSVGGYVAYQSTTTSAASVVIRVPAGEYSQVLGKVEGMGKVLDLTSNSNDVRVQYTDLNATLDSLRTEQGALLKLLNQSSTINSTLAIETQLQGVNQQINDIESQILQTRTLIDYATIDVSMTETAQQTPLSMSLSATPKSGVSPLSVTFNAVVKGGAQPYVVNYNFGDGYASEGQIVIHIFFQSGDYNVTVSATDQNGTSVQAFTVVHVVAAPGQSGVLSFFGTVSGLFVSVVEGIVEVAVVVLPIAAVGAAVIIPIQRRGRSQKGIKQPQ